jgi:hypothetical protein
MNVTMEARPVAESSVLISQIRDTFEKVLTWPLPNGHVVASWSLPRWLADEANAALAALEELARRTENETQTEDGSGRFASAGVPHLLPDDEVCACLDETGERKVRLYEMCQRCGGLMEADYLAAEVAGGTTGSGHSRSLPESDSSGRGACDA